MYPGAAYLVGVGVGASAVLLGTLVDALFGGDGGVAGDGAGDGGADDEGVAAGSFRDEDDGGRWVL